MEQLTVSSTDSNQRVDVFLAKKLGQSRSFWQRHIKSGNISVNHTIVIKASYLLEMGDSVSIITVEPAKSKKASLPDIEIIYEDSHIMVVNKPSGLLTHGIAGHPPEPTLADFAALHTSDSDTERPGIVHRLDRETSGLIMIAKDAPTKLFLQEQFRHRLIHKTYLALIEGHFKQAEALIDLPIGRKADKAKRSVLPSGKPAQTHYKVIKEYSHNSLIEVHPRTGRTHQIRVHLAHLGHPIVGDVLYGHKSPPKLKRLFLHASALEFTDTQNQTRSVQSRLPLDLSQFLDWLDSDL